MSPVRFFRELCIVLACAGFAVWGITHWLVVPWVVDGPSMEPALWNGDRVLVDLWTLRRRLPRPGEIVVFSGPDDAALVKRVAWELNRAGASFPQPTLPPESVLEPSFILLGDNVDHSGDSREFGAVPRHRITGRIAWRYWPPSRWGRIE